MKIATILGARPQFIKAAPVSRALAAHGGIAEYLIHTGQHYDENMSDVFFRELRMQSPKYNLEVGSGNHGDQTARMLAGIEKVLLADKPDWIIVYGDTNSTLAGALAGAKLHIPIAHIEAGLRSFNRKMPEEVNRVLTDHISSLLFAPTENSRKHLENEGIKGSKVQVVGDVMYDAIESTRESENIQGRALIERLALRDAFLVATIHRAENTDDPKRLDAIIAALVMMARDNTIVFPVHPRTKRILEGNAGYREFATMPKVKITAPLSYFEMAGLLDKCALVVTDSGGVQKEAYFFGKMCVTLRDETEWTELVDTGWNVLAPPTNADSVAAKVKQSLSKAAPGGSRTIYGDGHAARKVAQSIARAHADGWGQL